MGAYAESEHWQTEKYHRSPFTWFRGLRFDFGHAGHRLRDSGIFHNLCHNHPCIRSNLHNNGNRHAQKGTRPVHLILRHVRLGLLVGRRNSLVPMAHDNIAACYYDHDNCSVCS